MKQADIHTVEDIRIVVEKFYDKIKIDLLLGPIFNGVIKDNWEEHIEKLTRFWQTLLFEEHTYFGSPFPPHAQLPVTKDHFVRWIKLFIQTVDERFIGEKANEAKWRAEKMATIFQSKIEYYKNNS